MINSVVLYSVGDHVVNNDGEDCLVNRVFNGFGGIYYDISSVAFFGYMSYPKIYMSVEQHDLVNNIRYRSMSPKFNSVSDISHNMCAVNDILNRYLEKMYPIFIQSQSKFKVFLIFKLRHILAKNVHVSIIECDKSEIIIRFYEFVSEADRNINEYADSRFDMVSIGRRFKIKTLL